MFVPIYIWRARDRAYLGLMRTDQHCGESRMGQTVRTHHFISSFRLDAQCQATTDSRYHRQV